MSILSTTRQTKAGAIERTMDVRQTEFGLACTVLEHTNLKTKCNLTSKSYLLRKIAADFGQGFEVENLTDGETYHVHGDRYGLTCDCPGGTYKGKCRHVEIVRQAIAEKLL